MTLNGWRQPKKGRWRLEMPRPIGPVALTCAGIVAVLGGLALGVFDHVAYHLTSWLPFLPVLGTVYSWPSVGQEEGNIAGSRLADQIRANIGLSSYSMAAARDAALAELLAVNAGTIASTGLVFNVKDPQFAGGAKGNGVTDDTAAVQAAIDAACAVTGGASQGNGVVVYFPAGRYKITATLQVTRRIVLQGLATEGSVLEFNTGGDCINWACAVLQTRFGLGARDLAFKGQGVADNQRLFKLTDCQGIQFLGCTFSAVQTAFGGVSGMVNTSYPVWRHCFWSQCDTSWSDVNGASGSNENLLFDHCSFSCSTTGAADFNVYPSIAGSSYTFLACSFDSARLVCRNGRILTVGCHFEDPNNVLASTSLVVSDGSGGHWTSVGDYFLTRSTSNAIITFTSGHASIIGRWTAEGVNASCPAFVSLGSPGTASVHVALTDSGSFIANVTAMFSGTSSAVCGVLQGPDTVSADRGDASATVVPGADFQVQLWNTPLTATRTVTLNTALGMWGARFRIIRGTGATGAFVIDVGGLKSLTVAGQWCDVVLQQTGTWRLVASGSVLDGVVEAVASKNADYTLTASDRTVLVDASGAARTMTLPAAASHLGRVYSIKKTDSSANTVTVDGNASETIDGALTKVLTAQYEVVTIQSDGANWHIIA
jgi:hypothetical protein